MLPKIWEPSLHGFKPVLGMESTLYSHLLLGVLCAGLSAIPLLCALCMRTFSQQKMVHERSSSSSLGSWGLLMLRALYYVYWGVCVWKCWPELSPATAMLWLIPAIQVVTWAFLAWHPLMGFCCHGWRDGEHACQGWGFPHHFIFSFGTMLLRTHSISRHCGPENVPLHIPVPFYIQGAQTRKQQFSFNQWLVQALYHAKEKFSHIAMSLQMMRI